MKKQPPVLREPPPEFPGPPLLVPLLVWLPLIAPPLAIVLILSGEFRDCPANNLGPQVICVATGLQGELLASKTALAVGADVFAALLEVVGTATIASAVVLNALATAGLILKKSTEPNSPTRLLGWFNPPSQDEFKRLRLPLSRGLLLGLDFLIGAEVLRTVETIADAGAMERSELTVLVARLGALAAIVAIRFLLSYVLHREQKEI